MKPFSSQELVARVASHLKLREMRREGEQLLTTALEAARMFAWDWDLTTNKATSSPGSLAIIGAPPMIEVNEAFARVDPEDLPGLRAAIDQAVGEGGSFAQTVRFKHFQRNEWLHMDTRGRVMLGPDGRPKRIVGIVHDVTKVKTAESQVRQLNANLERKVEERTARLSEALRELETFASSVAHDLRGPLRAMAQLSEILIEDFAPKLGEDGQDFARRIGQAASRMDQLTTDLLEYSRLTRADVTIGPIDVDIVAREVLSGLDTEIQQRGATVDRELEGVVVLGNRFLLGQALTNLVANAIKFARPGVAPHVRLHATKQHGRTRLWVEDNGIGIDPSHRPRLFKVFERLDPHGPYPGTGIGLAIARKAVERMNGTIDLVSTLGKGSRFWIELGDASGG